MKSQSVDRITIAAYLASALFGGLNSIGVRFTVKELSPFWGATLRFVPAALLLIVLSLLLQLPFPKGRSLFGAALFGLLNFGVNYAFLYWGLQVVHAGLTQVILALVPLLTLIFAILHRQESFRWQGLIGALLAAGGILVVFGDQMSADVPLLRLLAVVLAAASFAEATVVLKIFPPSHPIPTNGISMAVGAGFLFLMSLLFGDKLVLPTQPVTWGALAYLILFGSCITFILAVFVIQRWTASATSYIFVILPFIAITASALLDNEKISLDMLFGAALVLLGVFIGAFSKNGKNKSMKEVPAPEDAMAG